MDESYIHTKGKTNEHMSRDPLPLCSNTGKETLMYKTGKQVSLRKSYKETTGTQRELVKQGVQFK